MYIDQARCGVNTGGKMTQKRTVHNLRNIARARQTDWWARAIDELHFIYASGARGVNSDFLFPTSYTGFAGNSLTSPDAYHIDYAGGRAGVSTITSADTMKCSEIDKIVTYLDTLGGGTDGIPGMEPIQVGGQGKHFVCVMHPYQLHTLKADYGETGWLTIQKAIGAAYGDKSPIFTGAAGMHNNVVLHSHKNVIKFSNYGSTSNLPAARALVLGRQALVVSYGSPGNKLRFSWNEETEDRGDKVVITSAAIFGLKKVTFNGLDFGLMAFDTYATTP